MTEQLPTEPQLSASVPNFPDTIKVKQNNGKEYLCARKDGVIKIGTVYPKVNGSGEESERVIWNMVSESRFNSQFKEV
jgi:hypothetical protein